MNAACPRCQKPMEIAQVDTIQVRLCQSCHGVLLAHPDLTQILESSWRAISKQQAEETQFHTPEDWKEDIALHCPDCGQTMEKYGYMGIGAIQIDRCDECTLVWLDTDELQNMVLALAKTNYRGEDTYNREKEESFDFTTCASPPGAYPNTAWLLLTKEDAEKKTQEAAKEAAAVAAKILLNLLLS